MVTLKQAQLQFVLLPCSLDGVIEATSHTLFFFGINHSTIIRLALLYSSSTYRFYSRLNEAQTSRINTGALIKEQTASIFKADLWVYVKYGKKNVIFYRTVGLSSSYMFHKDVCVSMYICVRSLKGSQ